MTEPLVTEPLVTEPLVDARDIAVRLGNREIIHDVDLAVAAGEIVTVIGPNGGGKTTLVRALLGLVPIARGSIRRVEGLTVGYVPQRMAVNPMMPVTVLRFLRAAIRARRASVETALAETGVAHLIDQSVHTLSGGEFRRVLLARALMRAPRLLALDEPATGVDHAGEIALYRLIQTIAERHGCGVLMVSHDLHVVMAATDRVICLNGHVCCAGEPEHVSRHSEYLRLFGAAASDALAFYRHHHDHAHALSGDVRPDGRQALHEGDGARPDHDHAR